MQDRTKVNSRLQTRAKIGKFTNLFNTRKFGSTFKNRRGKNLTQKEKD